MFWLIVGAVIAVVVLFKLGVFRHPDECRDCGKALKGTKQIVFKAGGFCLCKNCASKIHPQIINYAKENWSYSDYTDYLTWEETTKEERAQFDPDVVYGNQLAIDTERNLFRFGSNGDDNIVLRFADLTDYDLNFKPEEYKEGILGDKVKGNEYVSVELSCPRVCLESVIKYGVKLKVKQKGIISNKYTYNLSDGFADAIRAFSVCYYLQLKIDTYNQMCRDVDEVDKALALYMFDSMDEVTPSTLEEHKNLLMKAFDQNEEKSNGLYLEKIDNAYNLLANMI